MELIEKLSRKWEGVDHPFLIHANGELSFSDVQKQKQVNLDEVKPGDVVALIGDFDPQSISTLLNLMSDVREVLERVKSLERRLESLDEVVPTGPGWEGDASDAEYTPLSRTRRAIN